MDEKYCVLAPCTSIFVEFFALSYSDIPLFFASEMMNILIDYDNVHDIYRNRPLHDTIEKILSLVKAEILQEQSRVRVRLYGGWFEQTRSTRAAQRLSSQVQTTFPYAHSFLVEGESKKILVGGEMAYSLDGDHSNLTHTFRPYGNAGKIKCRPVPFSGCANKTSCASAVLESMLNAGQCTNPGCTLGVDDILFKAEQKLVDTMIVVDMVSMAIQPNSSLVLVSNDDDLWPGVRQAIRLGAMVTHIHPKPGRATPPHYLPLAPSNYQQASF